MTSLKQRVIAGTDSQPVKDAKDKTTGDSVDHSKAKTGQESFLRFWFPLVLFVQICQEKENRKCDDNKESNYIS